MPKKKKSGKSVYYWQLKTFVFPGLFGHSYGTLWQKNFIKSALTCIFLLKWLLPCKSLHNKYHHKHQWYTKQENKKTSNIEKWKWFPHCNCCLQASCWKSITRPSTRGICLTGQKLPQRTSTQVVEIKHFSWEVKPPPPLSSHSTKSSSSSGRWMMWPLLVCK